MTYSYVKRSAVKSHFDLLGTALGRGVWGGLGLQAMRTKSVLVLIFLMQVYHLYEWTKKKKVGRVAIFDESNW